LIHSLTRVDQFETELTTTTTLLSNISDRYSKTEYNVKQLTNTVNETEDKSEKLEKEVTMYKELVYATKQSLSDLKEHLKVQRQFNMITNIRGHLIWRISNYSRKFNESKESDVPIKSPLFSNKQYGYALRLDVHLNGIGTWKNRNMIACLTVVNGDFDTLLPWPCKLKADIILRDQPDDLNQATDITKLVITKKRNDKFEYQNQFIHIPHQVINRLLGFSSTPSLLVLMQTFSFIFSGNYIRNDALILEVKVQKTYDVSTFKLNSPKSNTPTQI
jgi:TNF receptor-associated factor 3